MAAPVDGFRATKWLWVAPSAVVKSPPANSLVPSAEMARALTCPFRLGTKVVISAPVDRL